MNQISEVVTTLEHYNVAVRDTLEYCIRKDSYDPKLYQEKKRSILIEVDQHTPLKDIIDHSGENGEKLEKAIREFYADVYGDDSTILKLADDGLRVDHNQHMAIYRHVLPIHENVNNMILGVLQNGHQNNLDVADVEKLHNADEAMYRGVAYMALVNDLCRLFNEYNQARNEAKGEETPASKFIGNDISAIIQNINFVRANAKITNAVYKNMEDKIVELMENMTGRRDLPIGKKFPDVMRETLETINLYVRDSEATFRSLYVPTINALIEQVKADDAKRAEAAKAEEEKKA
ncbi:MAG: hypothetical protein SPI62_01105 [Candidatus Enteromonas sp.]|nr:hypothetical protein [bacterium]MDD6917486.1 hypothetical protein [bacterium]MDY6100462.1 hypothetical protein [Candidatus Enteromonas sp.]